MAMRIRVVWGQTKTSQNTELKEIPKSQENDKDSSESTGFQVTRVFYDKEEWRKRNETMRAVLTPDMVSLLMAPGYDPMEN
jgi:hypothetical protein